MDNGRAQERPFLLFTASAVLCAKRAPKRQSFSRHAFPQCDPMGLHVREGGVTKIQWRFAAFPKVACDDVASLSDIETRVWMCLACHIHSVGIPRYRPRIPLRPKILLPNSEFYWCLWTIPRSCNSVTREAILNAKFH